MFLDPMCGSGTAPLFARALGYETIGIDSNPLAVLITETKLQAGTRPVSFDLIMNEVGRLRSVLQRKRRPSAKGRVSSRLQYWFWPSVVDELLTIRKAINESELELREKSIALLALSKSVRQVSKADKKVVPPTISKMRRAAFQGRPLSAWKAFRLNVRWISEVLSRPALSELPDRSTSVCRGDAMNLPVLSGTIDLCLFSPPYGTAHDYMRSTRLERLILWPDAPEAAPTEAAITVGRRRTALERFEEPDPMGLRECDAFIAALAERSQKLSKFLRLYLLQMKIVFSEVFRALKSDGAMVIVIGEGSSQGLKVPLGRLMIELAEAQRFELNGRPILNRIVTRGFMTKRNTTAGLIDREWILRFRK